MHFLVIWINTNQFTGLFDALELILAHNLLQCRLGNTNEIYDPNTFFIFVRQTNYFPNKKLIELTYDENLDIIIIDVACTTIFDNTMQTENNPKQKRKIVFCSGWLQNLFLN